MSPDRGVDEIYIHPCQPIMTNSKHKPASQVSVSICNWNWNLLQLPIGTLLTSTWTGETREVAGEGKDSMRGYLFRIRERGKKAGTPYLLPTYLPLLVHQGLPLRPSTLNQWRGGC